MAVFPSVVIAGGMPASDDPIFAYTQGRPKALLEMAGRPMIEWVLAALHASAHTGDTVIVGLPPETHLQTTRPVHLLPDQNSLIDNVLAGLAWAAQQQPDARAVIVSTADIPTLTSDIVDEFLSRCQPLDKALYYPIVSRQTIEARFPASRRTYSRLVDGAFAGGDLVLAQPRIAHTNVALWQTLAQARKYPWKMARIIGFTILLKLLFRRLRIADVERQAARLIGLPVAAVPFPHAEIAMDGDKPHQIDLLRQALASNN
ncbi:MAG: nucleotidyltransferase family protein [Anaerolineales bacterium]|nr:nucleotidyltransferase family protein [Anaerolineales bacterium]MCB8953782.1 NTP transferase domain-containing protein [Ardenticatenales bacterium]